MSRIRTIKPEFFTSEDIVSLTPMARLLYIALWCEADREGRMAWKPKTFKMRYFPADSCDIDALARELLASGLVIVYREKYAYIPSFTDHQHVNPRETASKLPNPDDEDEENDASVTRDDASRTVTDAQGGREGKGKECIKDYSPADAEDSPSFGKPGKSKPGKTVSVAELVAEGVGQQHAVDWLEVRKRKKAPLTVTAWEALKREAQAAGISPAEAVKVAAERGWQSFKAAWVSDGDSPKPGWPQPQAAKSRAVRELSL